MTDMNLIEFLQQPSPEFPTLKFQFAKTMAEHPHAYVVRTPANEAEYVRLFHRIGEAGVWEQWQDGRRYQYWYAWKYWRMTTDVTESQVINRAKA